MNKVLITGRITKNPDLRYTTSNIAVCPFSLAVNRNFKNAEGVYEADFINCIAYKHTAEMMATYLKKGDKIEIEGRLQVRNYEDKDGNKRIASEVIVEHLGFLESKKEEPKVEEPKEERKTLGDDLFADFGSSIEISDDDMPF